MFPLRNDFKLLQRQHINSNVCLCSQRAKYIKVWWWLLMCPGLTEGSTGVTASAWRRVSVGLALLSYCYSNGPDELVTSGALMGDKELCLS